jgi:hypothetical protein
LPEEIINITPEWHPINSLQHWSQIMKDIMNRLDELTLRVGLDPLLIDSPRHHEHVMPIASNSLRPIPSNARLGTFVGQTGIG